jgi:hypothetical protein
LKEVGKGGFSPISLAAEFSTQLAIAAQESERRLRAALTQTGTKSGELLPEKSVKQLKHVQTEFSGLSTILNQVRAQLAEFGSEEDKIAFRSIELGRQIAEASDKLRELLAAGKVSAEDFRQEMAALGQLVGLVPELAKSQYDALEKLRAEKAAAEAQAERERLDREAAERAAAFLQTLQDLQREQAAIIFARLTTSERLAFLYQQDLERFSEVEEAKALAVASNEAERDAISAQFALNRQAALETYQADLQAFYNSQGWRGVFGDVFARDIRQNEELFREWSESANQSLLLVQVAVEDLKNMSIQAFNQLAKGMGASIAHAIIYKQSIGEAMRATTAAVLEALASQAYYKAIWATAEGLLALVSGNFGAAAKAFAAAALYGAIATGASALGRAVAPQSGAAGSASGPSGAGTTSGAGETASGGSGGNDRVVIYVQGNIVGQSGVEELTEIINDAVRNRDVHLVATSVKQEGRALR